MTPRAKLNITSLAPAPAPSAPMNDAAPSMRIREARPDRVGKKIISGHFPVTTWAELRRLSIERQTTSQELLEEAIADLFAKYRRSENEPLPQPPLEDALATLLTKYRSRA